MTSALLALLLFAADVTPMERNGVMGLWLPLADARESSECLDKKPLWLAKLRLLTESDTLSTQEIVALRTALSDSRSQAAVLQDQMERMVESANSTWRSPALWFVTGIATAVVGILIAQ